MKYLIPFLLIGSANAADIESVSVGPNTMLVQGSGLANVQRAKLAKKPVGVMTVSDGFTVLYCRCERWPVGTRRLKLFTPRQKLLSIDVTVTGQEPSGQPPILPDERPHPAG